MSAAEVILNGHHFTAEGTRIILLFEKAAQPRENGLAFGSGKQRELCKVWLYSNHRISQIRLAGYPFVRPLVISCHLEPN